MKCDVVFLQCTNKCLLHCFYRTRLGMQPCSQSLNDWLLNTDRHLEERGRGRRSFLLFFWHKSVWMSSEAHQTIPDFYFYFHLCCCPSSSFWNVTVLQVWGPTEWLQGRLNTYTCRLPKNHQIVPALEIGLLLLPSISFSVESKEDRQPQKKPERAFSATSVGDLKRTIFK